MLDILQQLYGKWQALLNREEGEVLKKIICIDGKTMRSNRKGDEKPSHIIPAWSREDGFNPGQKAAAEKIRGKRADYVLALKGKQGTLHEEVKEYFADAGLREKIEKAGGYKNGRKSP